MNNTRESKDETPLEVINEALNDVGISIVQESIAAIHRIPGKKDQSKSILVKLRNIEKTRNMRKRAEIKSRDVKMTKILSRLFDSFN
jgi:hypothetical protein